MSQGQHERRKKGIRTRKMKGIKRPTNNKGELMIESDELRV